MKKTVKTLILSIAMIVAFAVSAYAAIGLKISFSDPEAEVGKEFEVSMKVNAASGKLGNGKVMLSYDTSYLEFVSGSGAEGGAGTVKVSGDSSLGEKEWAYKLKFKALQPGSTSIKISDWEIYDSSNNMGKLDHQGSSAITIKGDPANSVNANLSALKISPGSLTPAFSPDITEYTALVGGDCEKIAVSAPTADGNATVVISGNSDLQLGPNEIICKVTAQDGKETKEYKITVTKQEGAVEYGDSNRVSVNGVEYDVAESFDETILPDGFTPTTYNYKGKQVLAGTDASRGVTVMYLIADDGSGDFFIYDATTDTWSQYARIYVSERVITVLPLASGIEVPQGFVETTLDLDGKKVKGWVMSTDADQKYCIVYGMNSDGNKDFYRYDLLEKTIQRYFADPAPEAGVTEEEYVDTATMYNELVKDYNTRGYIMLALAVIAGLLLITLIIVLIMSRGGKSQQEERDERLAKASRTAYEDKTARRDYPREREQRPARRESERYEYERQERYDRPERQVRNDRPVRRQAPPRDRYEGGSSLRRGDDDFETFDL